MRNFLQFIFLFLTFVTLASDSYAATAKETCQANKNEAVAKYLSCRYRAEAGRPKASQLRICDEKFENRWRSIIATALSKKTKCFDYRVKSQAYKSYIRARIKEVTTLLGKGNKTLSAAQKKCRSGKTLELGRYSTCRQRAEGRFASSKDNLKFNQTISECVSIFQTNWQKVIDEATLSGATCYDNANPLGNYRSRADLQTSIVSGVIAGTNNLRTLTISLTGSPLSIDAGAQTGTLTITNTSPEGTAREIKADFSGTALEGKVSVIQNACMALSAGESCIMILSTGNIPVATTDFTIQGINTTPVTASLTITAPPAAISLTGSPLQLTNSGSPGVITVTNNGTISSAKNIKSNLTGTALSGKLTESANTCSNVSPGASCTITFTPGNVDVGQTSFIIQGDNTNQLTANASITTPPPTTAVITISGSPLQLETNGSAGAITVSNTSLSVTALNIASNFSGTALNGNVTETGNTCASLPPGGSCTLSFTPGSTVTAQTSFPISGSNTNTAAGEIKIVQSVGVSAVNSSSGSASGGTGVVITGTDLSGVTSITFGGVAATSVNVINSTTVTAVTPAHAVGVVDVVASTPSATGTLSNGYTYVATAVGQSTSGGTIACLNGGLQNLIAAATDNSSSIQWGGLGVSTSAVSNTDGASNTATIFSALGGGSYAAALCLDYEVDSQGNTPCLVGNTCYTDWFLPALDQLDCLQTNKVAIGGFAAALYWTSTESSIINSFQQDFSTGFQGLLGKSNVLQVRCVRAFTP